MKKHGFTLAEVLIALSIIAVGAAILAPTYLQLKPDRYKFKVLNCYKLMNEATQRLLSNPAIYYRKPVDSYTTYLSNGMLNPNTQYGCNGLNCTERPTQAEFANNAYTGQCKYPNLMMAMLNLENVTQCTVSKPEASGIMQGQIEWRIELIPPVSLNGYAIVIDLDPSSNGLNCIYNSNNCPKPDRFSFRVSPSGDISGVDSLTQVYLKNMTNTDKSCDFNQAAQP